MPNWNNGLSAFLTPASSTAGDFNLKTLTALADADATLTGAQMSGGLFTIAPSLARTLTTDTAVAILAAIPGNVDGSHFEFTIVNIGSITATLSAGVGVTLVGVGTVTTAASGTWKVRRNSSTTVSVFRT